MRTRIVRAAIAMALVPAAAGAQSLVLTEAQALERLSMDSPFARFARPPTWRALTRLPRDDGRIHG